LTFVFELVILILCQCHNIITSFSNCILHLVSRKNEKTAIVTMANYLAVPVKTTSEVDLIKPIRNFAKENFPNTSSENYDKDLSEFHRLRAHATGKFNDKHESAIEAVGKLVSLSPLAYPYVALRICNCNEY